MRDSSSRPDTSKATPDTPQVMRDSAATSAVTSRPVRHGAIQDLPVETSDLPVVQADLPVQKADRPVRLSSDPGLQAPGGHATASGEAPRAGTDAPSPNAAPGAQGTQTAPQSQAASAQVAVTPSFSAPAHWGPTATSRLDHLPNVVLTIIQGSARTGAGRARIDLRPPELGHVEIRLRYSSDGVRASLTAASPEAVQALGACAGDLKRALEAQGLTVLGLDVGHAGAEEHRKPDGDRAETPGPHASNTDEENDSATIETLRVRAAGSSIDVLG
jgi:hypothetical protein